MKEFRFSNSIGRCVSKSTLVECTQVAVGRVESISETHALPRSMRTDHAGIDAGSRRSESDKILPIDLAYLGRQHFLGLADEGAYK